MSLTWGVATVSVVLVDDPALPAAQYLTGAAAIDALAPAVAISGGVIESCRARHVQFRPGSDLIVRYDAIVVLADGRRRHDHLIASTSSGGAPPGTVPVAATTDDGVELEIGVWRWPFDPVLTGLNSFVTAAGAADALGNAMTGPLQVEVVAYRPTERAVVRVSGADRTVYVKVLAPTKVSAVVDRLAVLFAAGVPVPAVVAVDVAAGWVATAALDGPTLRELIKRGAGGWPAPDRVLELATTLACVEIPAATPVRSRIDDAALHARMLATVLPDEHRRLADLADHFDVQCESPAAAETRRQTIHGDLHEAQMIVHGGRIAGVLDVDDAGPGEPLDDLATLLAHLTFRSRSATTTEATLDQYIDGLRRHWSQRVDVDRLDLHTAAALTGLATGPFRVQSPEWQATTRTMLDEVERRLVRR